MLRENLIKIKEILQQFIFFIPRIYFLYHVLKVKNSKKNKKCFIIGNGPSIKDIDLSKIQKEDSFVVNHFAAGGRISELDPTYYCASDPRLFSKKINVEWSNLLKQYSKRTKFFFTDRFFYKRLPLNYKNIFFLNYRNRKVWREGDLSISPLKGFYSGDTVVIDFCIPLAIFMGYSEIYILGVDLFKANQGSLHFYDENKITAKRRHDEYLENEWNENVKKSFAIVKDYCESVNIVIGDLNKKSAVNLKTFDLNVLLK